MVGVVVSIAAILLVTAVLTLNLQEATGEVLEQPRVFERLGVQTLCGGIPPSECMAQASGTDRMGRPG